MSVSRGLKPKVLPRIDEDQPGSVAVTPPPRHAPMVNVYPGLRADEAKQLHGFELCALSENSRKAYTSDFRCFTEFLKQREPSLARTPEKAPVQLCLLFLMDMANRGLSIATINRRWAFLRHHLIPALSAPETEHKYRHVIAGMRRRLDAGLIRGKKPIMEKDLYAIVNQLVNKDEVTRQSRVLMMFLFHSASRRSETKATKWKNVVFRPTSMVVRISRSKTGMNQQIAIPRRAPGDKLPCVVKEMERWKRHQNAAETDFVFRKVDRRGVLTSDPITIREMVGTVKRGVTLLGLNRLEAEDVACHSTRSGWASSAADRGVPFQAIQERTRHRSISSLQPYLKGTQVVNHGI
jgi:integrase